PARLTERMLSRLIIPRLGKGACTSSAPEIELAGTSSQAESGKDDRDDRAQQRGDAYSKGDVGCRQCDTPCTTVRKRTCFILPTARRTVVAGPLDTHWPSRFAGGRRGP